MPLRLIISFLPIDERRNSNIALFSKVFRRFINCPKKTRDSNRFENREILDDRRFYALSRAQDDRSTPRSFIRSERLNVRQNLTTLNLTPLYRYEFIDIIFLTISVVLSSWSAGKTIRFYREKTNCGNDGPSRNSASERREKNERVGAGQRRRKIGETPRYFYK